MVCPAEVDTDTGSNTWRHRKDGKYWDGGAAGTSVGQDMDRLISVTVSKPALRRTQVQDYVLAESCLHIPLVAILSGRGWAIMVLGDVSWPPIPHGHDRAPFLKRHSSPFLAAPQALTLSLCEGPCLHGYKTLSHRPSHHVYNSTPRHLFGVSRSACGTLTRSTSLTLPVLLLLLLLRSDPKTAKPRPPISPSLRTTLSRLCRLARLTR